MTYLSQRRKSEARSRIMLSAGGVRGQAGGRGEAGRRAQKQRGCEGASLVTTEKREGWLTRKQSRPGLLVLGQLTRLFIAGIFSREHDGGHLPSPHPSASPAWFLTKFKVFRGIKKKQQDNLAHYKATIPTHRFPRGDLSMGGWVWQEGVAWDVSTRYLQNSLRSL